MQHGILIAAALIGPSDFVQTDDAKPAATQQQESGLLVRKVKAEEIRVQLTREQLKTLYTKLIRATARGKRPDAMEYAPRLLDLLNLLPHVDRVSQADKARMRKGLQARLEEMSILINRQLRRTTARTTDRGSRLSGKSFNGPAEERNARELINLIQTAIAPDSWEINGGNGTIFFYSPLNVLVVRVTSRVHGELGGTLDLLRD